MLSSPREGCGCELITCVFSVHADDLPDHLPILHLCLPAKSNSRIRCGRRRVDSNVALQTARLASRSVQAKEDCSIVKMKNSYNHKSIQFVWSTASPSSCLSVSPLPSSSISSVSCRTCSVLHHSNQFPKIDPCHRIPIPLLRSA